MEAKGRAFKASLEYLECKYDKSKIRSFFKSHPEFECIQKYQDLNWYSLEFYIRFSEKLDRYFGFGDAALLFKIGEYASRTAFESSHKLFRDLSMESAISNAQAVFLSYYSAAKTEIKYLNDNKVCVHIKNIPLSPYLKKMIYGWMQEAVKSIKSRDAFVSEQESRNSLCFTLEWNKIAG